MKNIILTTILICSITSLSYAGSLPANSPVRGTGLPSQTDINNEVGAMQDAQNQQQYQDAQQAVDNNKNQSDEYSNCPNCPHQ